MVSLGPDCQAATAWTSQTCSKHLKGIGAPAGRFATVQGGTWKSKRHRGGTWAFLLYPSISSSIFILVISKDTSTDKGKEKLAGAHRCDHHSVRGATCHDRRRCTKSIPGSQSGCFILLGH